MRRGRTGTIVVTVPPARALRPAADVCDASKMRIEFSPNAGDTLAYLLEPFAVTVRVCDRAAHSHTSACAVDCAEEDVAVEIWTNAHTVTSFEVVHGERDAVRAAWHAEACSRVAAPSFGTHAYSSFTNLSYANPASSSSLSTMAGGEVEEFRCILIPTAAGRYEYTARVTIGGVVTWAGSYAANAVLTIASTHAGTPTTAAQLPAPHTPTHAPYAPANVHDVGLPLRPALARLFPRVFRAVVRRLARVRGHAHSSDALAAYTLALVSAELAARGETAATRSAVVDMCLRLGATGVTAHAPHTRIMSHSELACDSPSSPRRTGTGGSGWFASRTNMSRLLKRYLGDTGAARASNTLWGESIPGSHTCVFGILRSDTHTHIAGRFAHLLVRADVSPSAEASYIVCDMARVRDVVRSWAAHRVTRSTTPSTLSQTDSEGDTASVCTSSRASTPPHSPRAGGVDADVLELSPAPPTTHAHARPHSLAPVYSCVASHHAHRACVALLQCASSPLDTPLLEMLLFLLRNGAWVSVAAHARSVHAEGFVEVALRLCDAQDARVWLGHLITACYAPPHMHNGATLPSARSSSSFNLVNEASGDASQPVCVCPDATTCASLVSRLIMHVGETIVDMLSRSVAVTRDATVHAVLAELDMPHSEGEADTMERATGVGAGAASSSPGTSARNLPASVSNNSGAAVMKGNGTPPRGHARGSSDADPPMAAARMHSQASMPGSVSPRPFHTLEPAGPAARRASRTRVATQYVHVREDVITVLSDDDTDDELEPYLHSHSRARPSASHAPVDECASVRECATLCGTLVKETHTYVQAYTAAHPAIRAAVHVGLTSSAASAVVALGQMGGQASAFHTRSHSGDAATAPSLTLVSAPTGPALGVSLVSRTYARVAGQLSAALTRACVLSDVHTHAGVYSHMLKSLQMTVHASAHTRVPTRRGEEPVGTVVLNALCDAWGCTRVSVDKERAWLQLLTAATGAHTCIDAATLVRVCTRVCMCMTSQAVAVANDALCACLPRATASTHARASTTAVLQPAAFAHMCVLDPACAAAIAIGCARNVGVNVYVPTRTRMHGSVSSSGTTLASPVSCGDSEGSPASDDSGSLQRSLSAPAAPTGEVSQPIHYMRTCMRVTDMLLECVRVYAAAGAEDGSPTPQPSLDVYGPNAPIIKLPRPPVTPAAATPIPRGSQRFSAAMVAAAARAVASRDATPPPSRGHWNSTVRYNALVVLQQVDKAMKEHVHTLMRSHAHCNRAWDVELAAHIRARTVTPVRGSDDEVHALSSAASSLSLQCDAHTCRSSPVAIPVTARYGHALKDVLAQ